MGWKKIGRWPNNALRHSFVSYRVAQSQNVAQTALEAGNSPAMIFENYRELVTKEEAARWFSIYHQHKGNADERCRVMSRGKPAGIRRKEAKDAPSIFEKSDLSVHGDSEGRAERDLIDTFSARGNPTCCA